jgi:hypothetical protein
VLDAFQVWGDFAGVELVGGAGDGAVLVGEVLGGEDGSRRGVLNQK